MSSCPPTTAERQRFYSKTTWHAWPCLEWTGFADRGRARFWFRGRSRDAARVAWFLAYGQWPDPYALHTCDNPLCVWIVHLFQGDDADNARDRNAKRRHAHGESHARARLTEQDVLAIRASGRDNRALADHYGMSVRNIWQIRSYQTWRHLP